uniref:Uncharacterized protein n=1 Tax=Triticum urartu TaxID=4572 RepID=A0A8R7QY95_TRIUA
WEKPSWRPWTVAGCGHRHRRRQQRRHCLVSHVVHAGVWKGILTSVAVHEVDAVFSNSDAARLTPGWERLRAAFADKERAPRQPIDLGPLSAAAAQARCLEDLEESSPLLDPRVDWKYWRQVDPSLHHQQPIAGDDEVVPLPVRVSLVRIKVVLKPGDWGSLD